MVNHLLQVFEATGPWLVTEAFKELTGQLEKKISLVGDWQVTYLICIIIALAFVGRHVYGSTSSSEVSANHVTYPSGIFFAAPTHVFNPGFCKVKYSYGVNRLILTCSLTQYKRCSISASFMH